MNKKILIIDDDTAIVESIKMLLEIEGYSVITMFDSDSVGKIDKLLPDLILLDIWISGVDGRDMARHLKSQDTTKNIPIIMISASRDIVKSAKEASADDFLEKPFEINDLLTKIASHIKNN